ncbi:TFIIH basal transcription factor complex, subunit SSL1 [Clavulina sp. PMI_390]|nr:TFIIH basal transcription factor complex, subunit SSL1 [Clavulina sp. PMI_390]
MPPIHRDGGSDYEDDDDDDDHDEHRLSSKGKGKASSSGAKGGAKDQGYTWEATYTRTWDEVQEDEGGSLQGAIEDLLARGRRRRLLQPTGAIRRTIIRHLVLLLDLSTSMTDKDMRPSRFELVLQCSRDFIVEWFDQNPLGQIGIIGMRGGLGERICEMTGNPQDALKAIADKHKLEPDGEPSLQNSVEMARASMSHLPSHSSREILILFGSLTTCDPGNVHDTVQACVSDAIRVNVVALAAEMKICRDFATKTGGTFGVALNETHFKDLVFETIPPPAQRPTAASVTAAATAAAANGTRTPASGAAASAASSQTSELLIMGFPTQIPPSAPPSLCVCHTELKRQGYICPRCSAKLCDVPTDCDLCGLMIVSSPHLARSYHHLFPVQPFLVQSTITDGASPTCASCSMPFVVPRQTALDGANMEGISPVGRYRCPEQCGKDFCAECDEFIHTVLHVCPGCTS